MFMIWPWVCNRIWFWCSTMQNFFHRVLELRSVEEKLRCISLIWVIRWKQSEYVLLIFIILSTYNSRNDLSSVLLYRCYLAYLSREMTSLGRWHCSKIFVPSSEDHTSQGYTRRCFLQILCLQQINMSLMFFTKVL